MNSRGFWVRGWANSQIPNSSRPRQRRANVTLRRQYCKHPQIVQSSTGRSTTDVHPAEEPKDEKNDQHQTQCAADPRSTIPTVPVIATAAAEQQDEQDNDQECAHSPPSFNNSRQSP